VPELPREASRRSVEARLEEAEGLAQAIGVRLVGARAFRLRAIRPATLLGKGQVEEVAALVRDNGAGLVVVDAPLAPIQHKIL
jgi:GTP-binding protein HflX